MTIYVSKDDGLSFPSMFRVDHAGGYSTMQIMPDGLVAVLYEAGGCLLKMALFDPRAVVALSNADALRQQLKLDDELVAVLAPHPVVNISPRDNAQTVLNAHGSYSAVFIFEPGRHDIGTLQPHNHQTLRGVAHAVQVGRVNISNKTGVVLHSLNISSLDSYCVLIDNSHEVTISACDIGSCGAKGLPSAARAYSVASDAVKVASSSNINIVDSYVHSEYRPMNSSHKPWRNLGIDSGDSIFLTGAKHVFIGGNVIAFGESNVENHACENVTIRGNFLLNPLGPAPRGNQVQTWGEQTLCSVKHGGNEHVCNSRNTRVTHNVALTCTLPICDPKTFPYSPGHWEGSRLLDETVGFGAAIASVNYTVKAFEAPQTWDAISFGLTVDALSEGNLVMGGDSGSGCGMIADCELWNLIMRNNVLDHTGQAGIGIAGGKKITVVSES
jgi:hypothetical protein